MYAGPIKLTSDAPMGLILEGPNSRPVECLSAKGNSFADLKDGHWVILEGTSSHEGTFVIRLHECRVIAAVLDEGSGPGLGQCHRVPSAAHAPVAGTPNK